MSETLSQDEVEALLRGVADGDVAEEEEAPPGAAVREYQLIGETRLVGRQLQALELAQERLVRTLRDTLASFIGTPPEVSAGAVETFLNATYQNRLASPASLHLFSMQPLRGQAMVVVSPPLAFGLVDRVFGGSGRPPEAIGGRVYSNIEQQVMRRIVSRVLADLTTAWRPLHPVTCAFVRSETNPASIAIAGPTDQLLVFPLQCDIGVGAAALEVVIPFPMIEPLRAKLGEPESASGEPDYESRHAIQSTIEQVEVTVSAELGSTRMQTRDVLALRVGDCIALKTCSDDPLAVRVAGIPLLRGAAGVSRGSNAIRVLAPGS